MTEEFKEFEEKGREVVKRERKTVTRERKGEKGKWNRDKIVKFFKWLTEVHKQPKAYSIDEVYEMFYKGSPEHLEEIKSDENKLKSFINTAVKTMNQIAKREGFPVKVGYSTRYYDKPNFEFRLIATEATEEAATAEAEEAESEKAE